MNKFQYVYHYINSKKLKANWKFLNQKIISLTKEKIDSVQKLMQYIDKVNEFDILINEIDSTFYIESMQNTKNKKIQTLKAKFESSILKDFTKERRLIDSKIINSKYLNELIQKDSIYKILYDSLKDDLKPLNDKSDKIDAQISSLVTEYNNSLAKMTLDIDGKNIPTIIVLLTKMNNCSIDKRKELLKKINEKENQFVEIFNNNYDKQIALRTEKSKTLGFSNYRDYKWWEYKRTKYTPKDVEHFCNSIRDIFIPIQVKFTEIRKERIGTDKLQYIDIFEEIYSKKTLNFFSNIEDLKEKVSKVFSHIHPEFKDYFTILEKNNRLDFEIRDNKSPAMFTSNFPESGIPFVYLLAMNNAQGLSSVFHETTHAIHSLYNTDKQKLWLKSPNIEANELFPLTIELISMEYWDCFLESEKDLIIAKLNKLEDCLKTFRMIGLWDKFQTWVFLNPNHSHEERNSYWLHLSEEFSIGIEPENKIKSKTSWQNRPLIFRAPFYMVEYGIATLGALSIYKNYRLDKKKTIEQLISAMKIGNTKPLEEIYKTAGVSFDFTNEKTQETGEFLRTEIDLLYSKIIKLEENENLHKRT